MSESEPKAPAEELSTEQRLHIFWEAAAAVDEAMWEADEALRRPFPRAYAALVKLRIALEIQEEHQRRRAEAADDASIVLTAEQFRRLGGGR